MKFSDMRIAQKLTIIDSFDKKLKIVDIVRKDQIKYRLLKEYLKIHPQSQKFGEKMEHLFLKLIICILIINICLYIGGERKTDF